jgi:hypothetical protein
MRRTPRRLARLDIMRFAAATTIACLLGVVGASIRRPSRATRRDGDFDGAAIE